MTLEEHNCVFKFSFPKRFSQKHIQHVCFDVWNNLSIFAHIFLTFSPHFSSFCVSSIFKQNLNIYFSVGDCVSSSDFRPEGSVVEVVFHSMTIQSTTSNILLFLLSLSWHSLSDYFCPFNSFSFSWYFYNSLSFHYFLVFFRSLFFSGLLISIFSLYIFTDLFFTPSLFIFFLYHLISSLSSPLASGFLRHIHKLKNMQVASWINTKNQ